MGRGGERIAEIGHQALSFPSISSFLWTLGPSQPFGNYSKLNSLLGKCSIGPCVGEEFPKLPPQLPGPKCSPRHLSWLLTCSHVDPWQFSLLTSSFLLQGLCTCCSPEILLPTFQDSPCSMSPTACGSIAAFPAILFSCFIFILSRVATACHCYVSASPTEM